MTIRRIAWEEYTRRLLSVELLEDRRLLAGNTTDGVGPNLIYDPGSGNVSIGGSQLDRVETGYLLANCQGKFHELQSPTPFSSIAENSSVRISATGESALREETSLGQIFPRGIPDAETLSQFLTEAALRSGDGEFTEEFDLIVRSSQQVVIRDSFDDDTFGEPPNGPERGTYGQLSGNQEVFLGTVCRPGEVSDNGLRVSSELNSSYRLGYEASNPVPVFDASYLFEIEPGTSATGTSAMLHQFILDPVGVNVGIRWRGETEGREVELVFSDGVQNDVRDTGFSWETGTPYEVRFSASAVSGTYSFSINDEQFATNESLPFDFNEFTGLSLSNNVLSPGSQTFDDVTVTGSEFFDLELSKSVDDELPSDGDVITWTLTISNDNSATGAASGVRVLDTLPQGLTFSDASADNGSYNAETGIWTLSDPVELGGSATLNISTIVQGTGGTQLTNTAEIIAASGIDRDSTPNNGTNVGEDDEAELTIAISAAADFSSPISGTVFLDRNENGTVDAGEGVANATVQLFADDGDGDFEPDGDDGPARQTTTDAMGLFSFVNIDPQAMYFVVQPAQTVGDVTLEQMVGDLIDPGAVSLLVDEFVSSQSATATPPPESGDASFLTVDESEVLGGERDLNVQITSGASEVRLRVNPLSQSDVLLFDSAAATTGVRRVTWDGTDGSNGIALGLGDLDLTQGGSLDGFLMKMGVDAEGAIARLRLFDDSATNFSEAVLRIPVTGDGSADELVFVPFASFTGPVAPTNVNAIQLQLDLNEIATIGQIDSIGVAGGRNVSFANDAAIDLEVTASVAPEAADNDEQVIVTVQVTNNDENANVPANGVRIEALLPTGLTLVDANAGGSDFSDGIWTLSDPLLLGADNAQALTIVARVDPDAVGNAELVTTAQVIAAEEVDTDSASNNDDGDQSEDDEAAAVLTVNPVVDLELSKTADRLSVLPGELVEFRVTVTNNDEVANTSATGVIIRDTLPDGLTIVTSQPNGNGTFDAGVWTLNDPLNPGESRSLLLVARADDDAVLESEVVNVAEVVGQTEPDADSTADNDDGDQSEDDEAAVSVLIGTLIDLSLSLDADNLTPLPGDVVAFTLTLASADTSEGPATDAVVAFELPAGFEVTDSMADNGSWDGMQWTLDGPVVAGGSATLTINATLQQDIDGGAPLAATAELVAINETDVDSMPGNAVGDEDDQDGITVTPPVGVDLALTKSVDAAMPFPGDTVTWTLSLTNESRATVAATGVQVRDELPAGVIFESADPSSGSFENGIWSIAGPLDPGTTETLTIVTTLEERTPDTEITNVAEVIASIEEDVDSTPDNGLDEDDRASATTTVQGFVDLAIRKSFVDANADTVTWLIEVTNEERATLPANGVQIQDAFPDGLVFVESTTSNGSFEPDSSIWTLVDPLAVGERATLEIVTELSADVPGGAQLRNVAEVVALIEPDLDSTPNNGVAEEDDQTSVEVLIPERIDLELTKSANVSTARGGDEIEFTLALANNAEGANIAAAAGVQVRDLLPAQLTLVEAIADNGSYEDGVWTLDQPLEPDTEAMLTIRATVIDSIEGGEIITNSAEVITTTQPDADSTPDNLADEDDESEIVITVESVIDLELNKILVSDSADDVLLPGQTASWALTLTNNDGNANTAATEVRVRDELPDGITLVGSQTENGSYANGVWTLANALLPGESAELTIEFSVDEGVAGGTVIANVSEVQSIAETLTEFDSTPANGETGEDDFASATLTVGDLIDLELQKSVSATTALPGDTVTWTLTLTNAATANADATGITVSDPLPDGVTLVEATASNGSYDAGVWTLADPLAAGESETLTLEVSIGNVAAGSAITNFAQVSTQDQQDIDSTPGNDDGDQSEDDEASAIVGLGALIDLQLSKTVDVGNASPGETVTWTLTLTNEAAANASATGVRVRDELPEGVEFVGATATNGSYTDDIWTLTDPLQPGDFATLEIEVQVDSSAPGGSTITNMAEVQTQDQADVDSAPGNDDGDQSEDDEDLSQFSVTEVVDLQLTKSADRTNVVPGETFTWTITLAHNSSANFAATGIQVRDTLPDGVELINASPSIGTYDGGVWDLSEPVSPGTTETLELDVQIELGRAVGTMFTNFAEVSALDQTDVDSAPANDDGDQSEDDEDSSTVTVVEQVDLELIKSVDFATQLPGEVVTWTIALTNAATANTPATGVTVRDALPVGVTLLSDLPSAGTYANDVWTLSDSLAPGETATLELSVRIDDDLPAGTVITNVAEVATQDQADFDSAANNDDGDQSEDDEDSSTITVGDLVDLELTKTLDVDTVLPGETATWTITASNTQFANAAATGVTIRDALPAGVALVNATPSDGDYTGDVWTLANPLAPGESETLELEVRVEAGIVAGATITNVAEVATLDQTDADSIPANDDGDQSEDDEASASLVVEELVDLSLRKSTGLFEAAPGDTVTWAITISNSADANTAATGVSVSDTIPAGLTLVDASASNGIYVNDVWTLAEPLAPGDAATLVLTTTVNQSVPVGTVIVNVAEVETQAQTDIDSSPGNDDGDQSEDDESEASIPIVAIEPIIDLELRKASDRLIVAPGEGVTWTITLTNTESANVDATGVSVTDALPNGVTLVEARPSNGSYANDVWTLGSPLAPGGSETLELEVIIDSSVEDGASIVNVAEVTSVDQPDIDSTPNNNDGGQSEDDEASVQLFVQQVELVDVELQMTADTLTPQPEDAVTFTVTVTNSVAADIAATGITVADTLPSGLTLVEARPSIGTFENGVWTVGSLAPGALAELDLEVTVDAAVTGGTMITNVAEVAAIDQPDVDSIAANDDGDQSEDDEASVELVVQPRDQLVDLELLQTSSSPTAQPGSTVSLTLTLSNAATADTAATGVSVVDALPDGLTLVEATTANGMYVDGTWTLSDPLAPGASTTLELEVMLDTELAAGATITNVAEVATQEQMDRDSLPANDDGDQSEDDEANFVITVEQIDVIDLELQKSASVETAQPGDTVTWALTLTNNNSATANATATGVTVTDALPDGVTLVEAATANGTYADGTWTLGTSLGPGGSATLELEVTIDQGLADGVVITNVAEVSTADQNDADSAPGNDDGDQSEDDEASAAVTVSVPVEPRVDLELQKTSDASVVVPGGTLTWTLTLTNAPTANTEATGVAVADVLPVGVMLVEATTTNGAYADDTWTLSDPLAPDATATLELEVTVDMDVADETTITNAAEVASVDQIDLDSVPGNDDGDQSEDDEASTTVTVSVSVDPQVDLELEKTSSVSTAEPGDPITWTVTLTNTSAATTDATGVTVSDALPTGVSLVEATTANGAYAAGSWTLSDPLAPGATASLTLEAMIDDSVTDGTVITNVAEVATQDQNDLDSAAGNDDGDQSEDDEDRAAVTITVPVDPRVDLELQKTVNATIARPGDSVTWTITLSNTAEATVEATGITVSDVLPASVTLVEATTTNGAYANGTWTLGDPLEPGATATIDLEVTVNDDVVDATAITNVAEVATQDQVDLDSSPANDDGDQSEDDEDSAAITVEVLADPRVDLELVKTSSESTVAAGEVFTWTIAIANSPNADTEATGVRVTDVLPAGVTLLESTTSNGSYANDVWTLGAPLAAGASATLVLELRVDEGVSAGTVITNVAQVSSLDQGDLDSMPGNDDGDQSEDDEDNATISVSEPAVQTVDLALQKTSDRNTAQPGDTVIFTVTVTNAPTADTSATGIQVTDLLPAGVSLVSPVTSNGTYVNDVWTLVEPLPPGESATLDLEVTVEDTVAPGTVIENVAQVSAQDQQDVDSAPGNDDGDQSEDDEDRASITVEQIPVVDVDLSLTKTANAITASPGNEVTWTITVTNAEGRAAATNVEITDLIPGGLTLIGSTPSGNGSFSAGVWSLNDPLEAGDSATLTILTRVNEGLTDGTAITNVAEITAHDQNDIDSVANNNTATEDDQDQFTVTIAVAPAALVDLELSKTADVTTASPGDEITWTISLSNNAANATVAATGVVVRDVLPAGLTFVSSSASNGGFDGSDWTIADPIDPGSSVTLSIRTIIDATAAGDDLVNVTEVVAANEADFDSAPNNDDGDQSEDDEASALVGVEAIPVIDLELEKTVEPSSGFPGEQATWTITLSNSAEATTAATAIEVTDTLPSGISIDSATPSTGTFANGIWTLNSPLEPGVTATLEILSTIDAEAAAGPLVNSAEVTVATGDDVDSTPANDDPSEDDQDSATFTVVDPQIDLSLTKSVDDSTPAVGDTITFTLTLSNDSQTTATNIEVRDELPTGLTLDSSSASIGAFDEALGTWTLASLSTGQSATLTLVTMVDEGTGGSTIVNSAFVQAHDQTDLDSMPGNTNSGEDDEFVVSLTVEDAVDPPDTGMIGGTAWIDTNGNGLFDSSESASAGWRIYADLNNDGVRQDTEPSDISGGDGTYMLSGLEPGDYTIRQELQPDFEQTFPPRFSAIENDKLDAFSNLVMPNRVAFADLDGTAAMDLVVLDMDQRLRNARLTNRVVLVTDNGGDPVMDEVLVDRTGGVRVVDLDGDDDDDLVLSDTEDDSVLLLNYENGQRQERTAVLGESGTVFVGGSQLNADALTDLYAVDARNFKLRVLIGGEGGQFTTREYDTGANPSIARVGDVDGDGSGDLIVANFGGDSITIVTDPTTTAATTRTLPTGDGPADIAILSIFNDGRDDVAVLNHLDATVSLFSTENGQLVSLPGLQLPVGARPKAMMASDLNGDGFADLVVINSESNVPLPEDPNQIHGSISRFINDQSGGFMRLDQQLAFTPLAFDLSDEQVAVTGLDMSKQLSPADPTRGMVGTLDVRPGGQTVTVDETGRIEVNFGNVCHVSGAACSITSGGMSSVGLPAPTVDSNSSDNDVKGDTHVDKADRQPLELKIIPIDGETSMVRAATWVRRTPQSTEVSAAQSESTPDDARSDTVAQTSERRGLKVADSVDIYAMLLAERQGNDELEDILDMIAEDSAINELLPASNQSSRTPR